MTFPKLFPNKRICRGSGRERALFIMYSRNKSAFLAFIRNERAVIISKPYSSTIEPFLQVCSRHTFRSSNTPLFRIERTLAFTFATKHSNRSAIWCWVIQTSSFAGTITVPFAMVIAFSFIGSLLSGLPKSIPLPISCRTPIYHFPVYR